MNPPEVTDQMDQPGPGGLPDQTAASGETVAAADAAEVSATTEPNGELAAEAEEPSPTGPLEWVRRAARTNTLWTFLVLLVLALFFTVTKPEAFATEFNIRNLATNAATLLVISVGMTFVIITAGIDLSVGSVLVFSGVIGAKTMIALGNGANMGWGPILVGILAALATGAGWGALNGILVAKARIPALIVTLGTLGMALGLAQVITDGQDVRGVPVKLTDTIGNGEVVGIPWLVVIAAVVTAIGALVLATTRFGRYTYAIGSNAEAARRVGINVDRHLIKIYTLAGLLAGLAGVLSLAHFTTTTIGGHSNDPLGAIAAVVLGGTSLFGGVGTVLGTVIGVFIPAVLENGFVILGVQAFWQGVAVGAVLIVAVYFDQLRRRARQRR
jgi:ribose transport system permease protein